MTILTEKYRPKNLSDMVGFVPTFSIDNNIPHLLLYGLPGTGKTTLAKIIIKMLNADSIVLNSSSERGIDVVRQKISEFASTQSVDNNIKIVFLDEADHLTNDAQTALRNTMETYAKNTRFILTCNYLNRIIEPLQSRCVSVKFDNISKEDIVERLKFICETEKIPYELNALNQIVDNTGSDMRSAINKIDELRSGVTLNRIQIESDGVAKEVFRNLGIGDFDSARQVYLDAHVDNDQFIKDLYFEIMSSKVSNNVKMIAIGELAEVCKFLNQVAWKEILVENALKNIMNSMKV